MATGLVIDEEAEHGIMKRAESRAKRQGRGRRIGMGRETSPSQARVHARMCFVRMCFNLTLQFRAIVLTHHESDTDKMAATKIPIVKKRTKKFARHHADRYDRLSRTSWRKP